MLSATAEVDRNAVCHSSYWRPLHDGSEHPRYYIMLSGLEVAELIATGEYHLPEDIIPASVLEWRKLQEGAIETIASQNDDVDLVTALANSVDRARKEYRDGLGVRSV